LSGPVESAPASIAPWQPVASQTPAACERIPEAQLDAYLEEIAAREGFTPDLLRAVISKESAYYPCAISSKGAQGLMQLTPATAAGLGVSDPFDPKENIDGGARYLAELLTRYHGDLPLALGAYNAGPSVVDTYQGIPPYPETIDYVSDILDRLN
jgi:soluble lytic murein transglycosylase-like protein